jgi:putative ABC transport system permease protein
MRALFDDVRFAVRTWRKSRGYVAIAIGTLALAIGATTAVFSIVEAVLLRPLPYANAERLVAIWDAHVTSPNLSKIFSTYDDFETWRRQSRSFEQIAVATWATGPLILTGRDAPKMVLAIPASVDLFRVLGVSAARGRTFDPSDATSGCTIVLSHRFWQTALGSPEDIVGRSLALDDRACLVVGVMPATFAFYPERTDLWKLITANREPLPRVGYQGVGVFARLKAGVAPQQAQAEVTALHKRAHEHDPHGAAFVPMMYPLQGEFTWLAGRNLRVTLWVLFAAVGVVLILACVNVANLLLGRFTIRAREFAIRSALGSGRWRLARQVLTESIALAACAAGLGILIADLAVRYVRTAAPIELPPATVLAIDWRVLAFAIALTATTAIAFGVAPAWRASRADIGNTLKGGGHTIGGASVGRRGTALFVAAQMTCAMVLLVVAGLLVESIVQLGSAPLGFNPEGLLTMTVTLPRAKYPASPQRVALYDRLVPALGGVPGVDGVAISATFLRGHTNSLLLVDGRPDPSPDTTPPDVIQDFVSPDYFEVLGVPLLAGRAFTSGDRRDAAAVAIVNEALAREYFPGEDPIGKRIRTPNTPWTTIVGVVGNQKTSNVFQEMNWVDPRFIYRPYAQDASADVTVIVRTASASAAAPLGATIQRAIATIDPDVPVSNAQTVRQWIAKDLAYPQFRAGVLGAFAAVALLLALVGLYAVLAQLVAQRTYEFGVRIALGATAGDVATLVGLQGGVPAVIGIAIGLLCTLASQRLLSSLLYGVRTTDVATLGGVTVILLALSAAALAIPARRAARVDPLTALRSASL